MKIVVCGWHFLEEFYRSLWNVNPTYPVYIVSHRDHRLLRDSELPHEVIENRGLEWGAYDYYLLHVWPEDDAVLFCHDDIKLLPLMNNDYELIPGEKVFKKISEIKYDQAYIFKNWTEDTINCGQHGRMVYFSERMLRLIKRHRGFPFDHKNNGYTGKGPKPEGVRTYNDGIIYVHDMIKQLQDKRPDWTMLKPFYCSNIEMGYRGTFSKEKAEFIGENLSVRI